MTSSLMETPPRGNPVVTGGRVVLVDDHELIRNGLRLAIDRAPGLRVVGEAGSLAAAERVITDLHPTVVVVDVRLPDGDGLEFVARLRVRDPGLGIVVLTMYAGDEQLFAALKAGASAFVGKDALADEVVAAVRHAAESPDAFVATGLAAALERRDHRAAVLTEREREVLDMLAEGFIVGQIASRLYIAPSTVKTHIAKIHTKLGAGNRAQALMTAIRMGLIDGRPYS